MGEKWKKWLKMIPNGEFYLLLESYYTTNIGWPLFNVKGTFSVKTDE